jgi:hypothetical protein
MLPLMPRVEQVAAGSYKEKDPPQIRGTGYVVESLEAALWAFHRTDNFRDGALLAVNLGDDADTTGAVYGQLAGTYYGEDGIPESWRTVLVMRELYRRWRTNCISWRARRPSGVEAGATFGNNPDNEDQTHDECRHIHSRRSLPSRTVHTTPHRGRPAGGTR